MADSILNSIKQVVGVMPDDDAFDIDIMMHINSVFSILQQIGVGPAEGYMIMDKSPTWEDYLGTGPTLNMVKSYMFVKVQLLFDPPATSFGLEAKNKLATEIEWRLQVAAEPAAQHMPPEKVVVVDD